MFFHIGGDVVVPLDELIAIIDLESACRREVTREFLNFTADEQSVVYIGEKGREKSVVITRRKIYFSPISTNTLMKRAVYFKNFCAV